jgi:hypothetical protein
MAKDTNDPTQELLQKLIAVQLHSLGAGRDTIARIVGRRGIWVGALLRGVPKPKDRR